MALAGVCVCVCVWVTVTILNCVLYAYIIRSLDADVAFHCELLCGCFITIRSIKSLFKSSV